MDFNLDGDLHVILEAYIDGTAIYFWKEGDVIPEEPIFVINEAPFMQYKWKAAIFNNVAIIDVLPAHDIENISVSETYILYNDYQTWVTHNEDIVGNTEVVSTLDPKVMIDVESNTITLAGTDANFDAFYKYPDVLERNRNFSITMYVSVDSADDDFSQLRIQLLGNVSVGDDPYEGKGRYHSLEFLNHAIYARYSGNSLLNGHGHPVLNGLEKNVFYTIEIKGTPQGSSYKIYRAGSDGSTVTPQSFSYARGYDARF